MPQIIYELTCKLFSFNELLISISDFSGNYFQLCGDIP